MDTKRLLNHFFLLNWFFLLCIGSLSAQMHVSAGKLDSINNFDSKYVEPRTIYIWLPDNYNAEEKYQVLYFNDGQMLFDGTKTWNGQEWGVDETMGQLTNEGLIPPTIVVGISNISSLRHSEYFPQKPFESLTEAEKDTIYKANRAQNMPLFNTEIQSDNYLKFIVNELKPFIDSQYSTYTDFRHTFIGGSSMGGLISMYAMCEYPKVFGAAICMSTHWPGVFEMKNNPIPNAFVQYLYKNLPSLKNHKIYFDYGDQTLDAMYAPYQKQVDDMIVNKKNALKNWRTKFFPGDEHSENSWRKRLHIPIEIILNP